MANSSVLPGGRVGVGQVDGAEPPLHRLESRRIAGQLERVRVGAGLDPAGDERLRRAADQPGDRGDGQQQPDRPRVADRRRPRPGAAGRSTSRAGTARITRGGRAQRADQRAGAARRCRLAWPSSCATTETTSSGVASAAASCRRRRSAGSGPRPETYAFTARVRRDASATSTSRTGTPSRVGQRHQLGPQRTVGHRRELVEHRLDQHREARTTAAPPARPRRPPPNAHHQRGASRDHGVEAEQRQRRRSPRRPRTT